jgi:hypothetical protein
LEAVRDSRMELYEIDAVTPGVGMTLRNLAGDGEKIAVEAEALARALPVGCLLGARVLRADGKVTLTGGILPFDEGMSAEGASAVAEAEDRAAGITVFWLRKTLEEQLGKIERPGALPLDPAGDRSPDPINWSEDEQRGTRTAAQCVRPPLYPPTKLKGSKDLSLVGVQGAKPPGLPSYHPLRPPPRPPAANPPWPSRCVCRRRG